MKQVVKKYKKFQNIKIKIVSLEKKFYFLIFWKNFLLPFVISALLADRGPGRIFARLSFSSLSEGVYRVLKFLK